MRPELSAGREPGPAIALVRLLLLPFLLGAATVAGFAPFYLYPLPILALSGLLLLWERGRDIRSAAVIGFSFGLGLFLTGELIQCYGLFARARCPARRWSDNALTASAVIGAVCVIAPPFFPAAARGYLWAFVWSGWVFLLEPFNYRRGAQSLYRDWETGQLARTLQLALAGLVCGVLWEFWNMWAYTKWVYIFPVGQDWKFFEMPLIGFLGFLPFALEYFVMFHFVASFYTTDDLLEV